MGIGADIIEVKRIEKAMLKNSNFIQKLFTKNEIEYLNSRKMRPEFVAGRFAAKEAVSKALGTGIRGFQFRDIEIGKDLLGKPIVFLNGEAKRVGEKLGNYNIHLSISHSKENAIAYAVLEVLQNEDCYSSKNEGSR